MHWILRKTTNRKSQLSIFALALLSGFILLIITGAPVLFWSLLFIGPVAVLIPPFAFPHLIDPGSRSRRIFFAYIMIILFGIFLLFGIWQTGLIMDPAISWPTPVSNAAIYAGLVILDTLFAFAVYRIMLVLRPVQQVEDEKPV